MGEPGPRPSDGEGTGGPSLAAPAAGAPASVTVPWTVAVPATASPSCGDVIVTRAGSNSPPTETSTLRVARSRSSSNQRASSVTAWPAYAAKSALALHGVEAD